MGFNYVLPTVDYDLPPNHVPHLELGFCKLMFFNLARLLVLEDGNSMSCAA